MSITLLFGCCQVETATSDLAAVRSFLVNHLGGRQTEQLLASQIAALMAGTDYDVDHIDCGDVVFQINQPSPRSSFNGKPSVHQAYLDASGPCVTNLNFYVDDIDHARTVLSSLGAETHIEGPSSVVQALADYGARNTRSGGDARAFLFMGTRKLIGLDLEIMEPNFERVTQQTAQFPGFWAREHGSKFELRLHRLLIAVPDLRQTYDNLVRSFAPASLSKPYAAQRSAQHAAFRIGLGGIEIEYCQPTGGDSELSAHLRHFGPGVVAAVFGAPNPSAIIAQCLRHPEIALQQARDHISRLNSRSLLGFDIWLEAPERLLP